MSELFMTDQELSIVTGYKKPSKQIDWLVSRNWPFEVNAARHPIVLKDVMRAKLGDKPAATIEQPKRKWEPDFKKAQGNTT